MKAAEMTEDQQDYVEQVFERARNLIRHRVWDIKLQRFHDWLGCFENHNATLLAAYLLDNLCFRSKDQFASMLDVLFSDAIVGDKALGNLLLIENLKNKPDTKIAPICLSPVLGTSAPPTKSGPYILRLAQRRYRMKPEWMAWPTHINYSDALTDVIFVDDFCGTGEQFCEFAAEIDLCGRHNEYPHVRFWYYVATIHEQGLDTLATTLPFLKIKYAERLTSSNSVLSDESFHRYQIPLFQDAVREAYERVVSAAGLPRKGGFASGYGKLGLAYAYAHATPNNTLPIFWMDTANWTSLLDR